MHAKVTEPAAWYHNWFVVIISTRIYYPIFASIISRLKRFWNLKSLTKVAYILFIVYETLKGCQILWMHATVTQPAACYRNWIILFGCNNINQNILSKFCIYFLQIKKVSKLGKCHRNGLHFSSLCIKHREKYWWY